MTGHVVSVSGLRFEARLAAGAGVRTVCGARADRLETALEAAARAPGCAGIISFGTAGGLDPALAPGAWVIAQAVVDEHDTLQWDSDAGWRAALAAALPGARLGRIAGVALPVADAAAKAALWRRTGALVVDMESHLAARVAARHGLPFAACRVVVDPAQRSLPPCALVGVAPDGRALAWPVFAALCRAPRQLPALLRVAGDARAAQAALRQARPSLGAYLCLPGLATA